MAALHFARLRSEHPEPWAGSLPAFGRLTYGRVSWFPRLARPWGSLLRGLVLLTLQQVSKAFRVYPESYAALFLTYLNGIGFRASSGASRLVIPPIALILIQASLDSVRRS